MRTGLAAISLVTVLVISCNSSGGSREKRKGPGKSEMEELNRYMVRKDRERIQSYIERKKLDMKETPSGLWYSIKSEGIGDLLKERDIVEMEYDCSLLDGTACYSSEATGPKVVVIGKTGIEPGLDQGLRMLKPGAEAIFIIPPYMAFGLPGDGKKIPSRAVIVYNVKIKSVRQ